MPPVWLSMAQGLSLPALAVSAVIFVVIQLIKVWPQLKQMDLTDGASREGRLMTRVSELEARVKELEKALGYEQAKHSADTMIIRHELVNESASFEALVLLIKTNPDRVAAMLPEVMEMRERGKQRIALEKGAMAGATISAAGDGG